MFRIGVYRDQPGRFAGTSTLLKMAIDGVVVRVMDGDDAVLPLSVAQLQIPGNVVLPGNRTGQFGIVRRSIEIDPQTRPDASEGAAAEPVTERNRQLPGTGIPAPVRAQHFGCAVGAGDSLGQRRSCVLAKE